MKVKLPVAHEVENSSQSDIEDSTASSLFKNYTESNWRSFADLEEHIHSLDFSDTTMPTEVKAPLTIC